MCIWSEGHFGTLCDAGLILLEGSRSIPADDDDDTL